MDTILYHGMEGGVTNRALHNQWHTPEGGHIKTIMGGDVTLLPFLSEEPSVWEEWGFSLITNSLRSLGKTNIYRHNTIRY